MLLFNFVNYVFFCFSFIVKMQDEVTIQRRILFPLKGWKSSKFGNDHKKSKFYSGRNEEQVEVTECLLLFGKESSVFQFAIQIFKD